MKRSTWFTWLLLLKRGGRGSDLFLWSSIKNSSWPVRIWCVSVFQNMLLVFDNRVWVVNSSPCRESAGFCWFQASYPPRGRQMIYDTLTRDVLITDSAAAKPWYRNQHDLPSFKLCLSAIHLCLSELHEFVLLCLFRQVLLKLGNVFYEAQMSTFSGAEHEICSSFPPTDLILPNLAW